MADFRVRNLADAAGSSQTPVYLLVVWRGDVFAIRDRKTAPSTTLAKN